MSETMTNARVNPGSLSVDFGVLEYVHEGDRGLDSRCKRCVARAPDEELTCILGGKCVQYKNRTFRHARLRELFSIKP